METNSKLSTYNPKINKAFNWILGICLITNIIGVIFQGHQHSAFMESNPGARSNWGMLIGVYMMLEVWLFLLYLWSILLSTTNPAPWFKAIQLFIIFVLGVIPGVFFAVMAFFFL